MATAAERFVTWYNNLNDLPMQDFCPSAGETWEARALATWVNSTDGTYEDFNEAYGKIKLDDRHVSNNPQAYLVDVTLNDILTGKNTLTDVTPATCTDISLRNFKANALFATASWETESVRNEATSSVMYQVNLWAKENQWDTEFSLKFALDAINWGIQFDKDNPV